jgi:hypothetical protein
VLLPAPRGGLPPTSTLRDMEIVDFLFKHFKRVTHQGEIFLQPLEAKDKQQTLFCLGKSTVPLRVRFVNPVPELRSRLTAAGKSFFAPQTATAQEVIGLANLHATKAYA